MGGVKRKSTTSLCDWSSINPKVNPKKSYILRFKKGYKWKGTKTENYKDETGSWTQVTRNVLIGKAESTKFHIRYFEISQKGYTSLEYHKHEHVVICIRGKGKIRIGNKKYNIGYLDTVFIAPGEVHQLMNPYEEPFGFFCIVNSKRDKPKIISPV
ncbi:MAG: cupin domain-containing protein [Thermodesulfovibrionales bacterium]|nr:cupin domain-containing protein [Thermodesulfovibrionales bacterium]